MNFENNEQYNDKWSQLIRIHIVFYPYNESKLILKMHYLTDKLI